MNRFSWIKTEWPGKCLQCGTNYQEAQGNVLQLPPEPTFKISSAECPSSPWLLAFLQLNAQSFCTMPTLSCDFHPCSRGVISDLKDSSQYISFQNCIWIWWLTGQIWHSLKNCGYFTLQSLKVMQGSLELPELFLVLLEGASLAGDLIAQPSEKIGMTNPLQNLKFGPTR